MRTSARNQFPGKVIAITTGPVNAEITLAISEQAHLHAIVTSESVTSLGLSLDSEAYALVEASFIMLMPADDPCATSARTRLCGAIAERRHGPVSSAAVIELAGGRSLAAVISAERAKNAGLNPGARVCALFKASPVILGVH